MFRFVLLSAIVITFASLATAAQPSVPPNIVIVLSDDMGYSDLGCYGGEIDTPVLDSLAAGGLRYTQMYNASRCCPTRAALLTGLYSHQAGIGLMTENLGYDSYRGDLSRRAVTIPEALAPAGYHSYMSGKWHLTRFQSPLGLQHNWPLQRGFERFYGTMVGAGTYYDPPSLCRGNAFITPVNDSEYQPAQFYYTDAISDNAVRYLADHARQHAGAPFFLYVAYTAPHWPMHAPEADIAKYRGRYDDGYDAIRAARYARGKELGVIDPRWPMSPGEVDWQSTPHQAWERRSMEVYAAMVDNMDRGIGRIVDQIKRQGAWENTLFVYLQDNGASAETDGRRSNAAEIAGLTYAPLGRDDWQLHIYPPMQTRDGRPLRTGPEVMPGADDTFVAYGRGWANVSNTPFRGYKHESLEGGISTPLIVHWPRGIPADRAGRIVHDPAHLIDLMATCVDVVGAIYPGERGGQTIQPMEGLSLRPTFTGQALQRTKPFGFEHHGNLGLRDGKWKIVSNYRAGLPTRWALYDMDADRTELKDLSAEMPDKRAELVGKWQAWANRVGVQPWPIRPRIERP